MTCGEAPANYEIRTVSSPARVPLTDHATEHVVLPAELAVTNTCHISTDVRQYPTDCANKTLQLCQPLSAIDTQKNKVAESINDHDVVGTGSTYSAHATVNSLWRNLPSMNRSTLQEGTPTCQRMKLACDNCGKTFTSSSGLWKHALIHKDGRSHSCSYCGKQFNRHENMLRHQRAHAGVKPFKCSVCGKAFVHNITLARHQVIHTCERPYSCDICEQTFSWKTLLTLHRLTHDRHNPNICAMCGRAFLAKQGLRRHTGIEDQQFLFLIQDSFLTQHVLEPTRRENVLDIVLSSQKELVDNLNIFEPLGNSDHNQIHFDINVKSESKNKKTYKRNFHKGNYKDMRKYLAKLDWNNMLMNKTAIECWNILKYEIESIIDKFVPFQKQGKRCRKKHLSKEAIRKIMVKQTMWRVYRRTRKEEDYAKYKEALNAATTEIRQSKRSYEQKLACNIKNDSKSFYAYVRSKQNVQDKVGPLEDSAGNLISQGFLMAEDLNGYFSSVFTKEDISSLPVADAKFQGAKSDYLGPLVVTPELVAKKIKAMKDNKTPGVDGIPPKLLMETVEQISIPLARVFNLSLKEGVVPFEWKEANIIPLFKKGSRNKSENYRPVSLTSVICKLLERLIKDHMVDFLVKHKLLNSSQHGFLKARSCLTNMLCFLEEITKWIDVGSPVDIIYLDFQKAFDKVPHQRLLLKLKAHGIGDSITDWIEQWLIDRRQRVVVDGEVSNWKSVLSGVPQGSVLGPILFLIYINDLDDSITSNVLKFADDTKLFRKVNTDGDKQHLQNDLDRLVKWSEKWQMLFNFGKCKCLHTGHGNLNVNYKMGDTVLGTTVKEKDLGVTISADMKVSEQCSIAASKGNQILGLIRRNITYKG